MDPFSFTDEQILSGISAALKAKDMTAVVDLMHVLALQAPDKAKVLYDAIANREITVKIPFGGAEVERLTSERDRARRWAVRLEQENHELRDEFPFHMEGWSTDGCCLKCGEEWICQGRLDEDLAAMEATP